MNMSQYQLGTQQQQGQVVMPSHAYNLHNPLAPLAADRILLQQQMNEAVKLLPREESEAYLEALQRSPELVRVESDPPKFLRYCDNDVFAAARRICCYWKERKDLFGPTRAFLPLVLSGHGALNSDDIRTITAGQVSILPDTVNGQKVMLADRRQWVTKDHSRLRALFHTFQVLSEDDKAQTEGVLALVFLVTRPRIYELDPDFMKRGLFLMKNAFPAKLNFHMLNWLPKGNRYVVQDLITGCLSQMIDFISDLDVEVHIEREPGQLVSELQELGLTRKGIPFCVGGQWKLDEFTRWCVAREQEETKKYLNVFATISAEALPSSFATRQDEEEDEEARLAKKRLANVVYSRRKRERRKQEFDMLRSEADGLAETNGALKAENARLQDLLGQAKLLMGDT